MKMAISVIFSVSYSYVINNLGQHKRKEMQKDTSYITSVRFTEQEAEIIKALAKQKERSVGRIVRDAIRIAYFEKQATAA